MPIYVCHRCKLDRNYKGLFSRRREDGVRSGEGTRECLSFANKHHAAFV